jgi:hypothetical protein
MRWFYTHRYAERGERGRRAPRVAAALPALPEATLLASPRGALAATRHFGTMGDGVYSTNVYLNGTHGRGATFHGDALVPRAFSAVTYKIVPKRHGE